MGSAAQRFDLFSDYWNTIDGKLVATETTRHGINPATGEPGAEVPVASKQHVDATISAGLRAFETWKLVPWAERAKAVSAFADALETHAAHFAKLLTQEQGKPVNFAHDEVVGAASWLRDFTHLELQDEIIKEDKESRTVQRFSPLGLVIGIVPWNFPIHLACGKIGPAVLMGNCIVIKPSPFTPYCGLKLGELAQRYFPPGVIQVLSGDDTLGPMLTNHPGPAKISFTGSIATGKKVMESAARTLKRVTLELGGNDPAIICQNVDIAATVKRVVSVAFANSGQICISVKRIYVHEAIYDQFLEESIRFTRTLKVGHGAEEGVNLGPVQNSVQFDRVKGFFDDIEKEKWEVAVGGENPSQAGYFINPTIIDRPPEESRIVTEEPFGPIVPLLSWSHEAEVIKRANNTKMGLGASVWSKDLEEASRIARQLEAGSVWVNTHAELDPTVSFGGHKESGIGYEYGRRGLQAYCNVQTLFLKKV